MLARAEAGYPLATPRPGWVEQDPEDWWRAAGSVLGQLRAQAGRPAGLGLSGQMHGLVALDGADRILRPAILWNDQRTAAQCAQIEQTRRARAAAGADRQPRPDRLHRTQAAVAARTRARDMAAGAAGNAAQGLRAPAAVWHAGRPTSPTHREPCCSTYRRTTLERAPCSTRWRSTFAPGCRRCSRARRSRGLHGGRDPGCRRGPATRRPARLESAWMRRRRPDGARSAPRASCSPPPGAAAAPGCAARPHARLLPSPVSRAPRT